MPGKSSTSIAPSRSSIVTTAHVSPLRVIFRWTEVISPVIVIGLLNSVGKVAVVNVGAGVVGTGDSVVDTGGSVVDGGGVVVGAHYPDGWITWAVRGVAGLFGA